MKKVIKQENQTDIEVESFTENHITISQQGVWEIDEVVIEKTKSRELSLVICPELHSELETIKEQNKKLTDCVNAGIELAKSAETVSSSLEKAIELLKDAELCLEVQLQDVISRGALAALLQRIKSATTFLEGRKQD